MPRVPSPLSSNDHWYFTWNYIFIRHISWVLLGASCIIWFFDCFAFYFVISILAGHTYLRKPKLCYDLLELLFMLHINFLSYGIALVLHLYLFQHSGALIFLKKYSPASLRFIWEFVKFWRNYLMLHLYYFERWNFCAHGLHLNLFELVKSKCNIWN